MSAFEISVTRTFPAQHQLRLYDGELEPLHQHDWRVTVTFTGPRLDPIGVLLDFTEVEARLEALLEKLCGRNLNQTPEFAGRNPSAEALAVILGDHLAEGWPDDVELACVEVEEAPGCVARHRRSEQGSRQATRQPGN